MGEWHIDLKSKELGASRKEMGLDGKVEAAGLKSSILFWRYMWIVGLALAAVIGYCMEEVPVRVSDAMWINHLFSEYRPPRRVHMHLLHRRKSALLMNYTEPADLWDPPSDNGWKPCLKHSEANPASGGDNAGYLQIFCSGGLFQLHICVCNAVAVARILNATLVIPFFKESPLVWDDPSKFHDIYDIDHFMSYFKEDVRIVRELPSMYSWSTPTYYDNQCLERPNCLTNLPKHAPMNWYLSNVTPILQSHGVAVLDNFDHKLSFEGLPAYIANLRCQANFEGLQFVAPIRELGKRLVERMRAKGKPRHSLTPIPSDAGSRMAPRPYSLQPWWGAGWMTLWYGKEQFSGKVQETGVERGVHYVGLHIRFEKDMVAHSACYYGGGRAEKQALAAFRAKVWRNKVSKAIYKPEYLRANGSCPLTPEEVGLLLSGMGFGNNVPIYIASKRLYGGQARIKPLKEMFPLLESKYTLAFKKELGPFLPHAHKLAALDFIVLLNSDVFMSNAAGNFPNVLSGQRTFFGPRKSIHPDKALLANVFANSSISWKEFSSRVVTAHKSRLGAPVPRMQKYSIFRYPAPDCMCQQLPKRE